MFDDPYSLVANRVGVRIRLARAGRLRKVTGIGKPPSEPDHLHSRSKKLTAYISIETAKNDLANIRQLHLIKSLNLVLASLTQS